MNGAVPGTGSAARPGLLGAAACAPPPLSRVLNAPLSEVLSLRARPQGRGRSAGTAPRARAPPPPPTPPHPVATATQLPAAAEMAPPQPRQAVLRASTQRFLRGHPTVERLLRGFLRELLIQRPDNVLEFAAEYFTNPELPHQIQEELGGPGAAEEGQGPAPRPGGM